jgi:hypothetical protein
VTDRFSLRDCFVWSTRSRIAVATAVLALAVPASRLVSQQVGNGVISSGIVTFTLDFPQSNPQHYSISVDGAGRTHYECTGKVAEDAEEQTYRLDFEVSAGNREKIFGWTKQAKYFAGNIDSQNAKLAFTGAKVLTYQDGQQSHTGRYNYSNSEPVRELTSLFQNMASTLEYGHRLAYYHRYQKLALDDELKRMETQARNNELSEIQSVAPVLQEIVNDSSVINVVRARAKEIMERGNGATAGR